MNDLVVFDYKEMPVRTLQNETGIWWVLADVCRVLEIKNPRDAASHWVDGVQLGFYEDAIHHGVYKSKNAIYNDSVISNGQSERGCKTVVDLKKLREEACISQEKLASMCDRVRQTIGEIEAGRNKPSIELAKKLGEIFNIPWTAFFED